MRNHRLVVVTGLRIEEREISAHQNDGHRRNRQKLSLGIAHPPCRPGHDPPKHRYPDLGWPSYSERGEWHVYRNKLEGGEQNRPEQQQDREKERHRPFAAM